MPAAFNGDDVTREGTQKLKKMMSEFIKWLLKRLAELKKDVEKGLDRHERSKRYNEMLEYYGLTKELKNYIKKGGQMNSIEVHDKDFDDFVKHLKENGVMFFATDVLGDNCKCIRYRAADAERVQDAIDKFKAERNIETEMSVERFQEKFAGHGIFTVEGIDPVELELLRHYAAKNNFQFAVEAIDDGSKCKVYFSDKEKMDAILHDIGWQMTGEKGPIIREQIEYRIAGRTSIATSLYPDAAEKEFFIASKSDPGMYMQFTAEDFKLYKNDKVISTISRSDDSFFEQAQVGIAGMKDPVKITSDEWSSPERASIIEARQEVIPTGISAAEQLHMQEVDDKEQRAREIYNAKLSLDNSYSLKYNNSMEDPSVSFEAFFSTECINDDFEEDIAHAVEASAYLYNKHMEAQELYTARDSERDAYINDEISREDSRVPYGTDSRYL